MKAKGDPFYWSDAEFSADRTYRYKLTRRWNHGPVLAVIGLNPSTADENFDDPTVRRCIGYARDWGFSGLWMLNLFAFRATDPKELIRFGGDPVGEYSSNVGNLNRFHIENQVRIILLEGGAVLAAWGAHGAYRDEGKTARWYLEKAYTMVKGGGIACLGLTKQREPKHPLYLSRAAKPIRFLGNGGRLVALAEKSA